MISLDLMKLSEVRKAGDRSNWEIKTYDQNCYMKYNWGRWENAITFSLKNDILVIKLFDMKKIQALIQIN